MKGMIAIDDDHVKRVRSELVKVGMTAYGLLKSETRHLPELIHPDERIGGVVYGRYEGGSGMIVATDQRVIFLDYKPFYRSVDEIKYDVISGVSVNKQDGSSGVVLHTRLGDYKLRFVNNKCAQHFMHFIEDKSLEMTRADAPPKEKPQQATIAGNAELSQPARMFLGGHEVGVFSTIDRDGNVHGSVVYYAADKNDNIYIVTKEKTKKAENLESYNQVALTIFDATTMQTLQISGHAHVEDDPKIQQFAQERILRPRFNEGHAQLPPVLYIPAGKYVVICIKPTSYTYNDYKK